jgi:hypothetical protein
MTKKTRLFGGSTLALAGASILVARLGATPVPHVTVTGQLAARERASNVTTISGDLLEQLPTGRKFDQVVAQLPESRDVQPGYLPEGWRAEQNGRSVRMWGPALDHVRFRLDLKGTFTSDYAGKAATLQSSYLTTKDDPLKLTITLWPKVEATPNLEGILTLPPQGAPGQPMLIGVAPGYRDGRWDFSTNGGTMPLIPVEQLKDMPVIKSVPQSLYQFRDSGAMAPLLSHPAPRPYITAFPEMGAFTSARYTDPWGEVTVDAPVTMTPASPAAGARVLSSASSLTFAGQAACVSGRFPTFNDAYGLLLDGKTELQPWGASSTTIMLGIPDNTPAGPHTIGTPDGSSKVTVGVLTVEGSLDQNKLWRGESTTMRLRVVGTDRQFPLAVLNRTPDVIGIDGGVRQLVTTPGGSDNAVTRSVTGIHRGNFTIVYSVNAAGCG